MFYSKFDEDNLCSCVILCDTRDCVSDHLPLKTSIKLKVKQSSGAPKDASHLLNKYHAWTGPINIMCEEYISCIQNEADKLQNIMVDSVKTPTDARKTINGICDNLKRVIHSSSSKAAQQQSSSYQGKHRKKTLVVQ